MPRSSRTIELLPSLLTTVSPGLVSVRAVRKRLSSSCTSPFGITRPSAIVVTDPSATSTLRRLPSAIPNSPETVELPVVKYTEPSRATRPPGPVTSPTKVVRVPSGATFSSAPGPIRADCDNTIDPLPSNSRFSSIPAPVVTTLDVHVPQLPAEPSAGTEACAGAFSATTEPSAIAATTLPARNIRLPCRTTE